MQLKRKREKWLKTKVYELIFVPQYLVRNSDITKKSDFWLNHGKIIEEPFVNQKTKSK